MAMVSVIIPKLYRRILYSTLLISWCTGIAFFIFSRFISVEGDFGPEKHPWQFPILIAHGGAAFLMLMAAGSLLSNHMPSSWRQNKQRKLGICLVTLLVLQILTAYGLYYLSSDEIRGVVANIHAALGFAYPFVVLTHVLIGKRHKRNMLNAVQNKPRQAAA